MRLTGHSAIEYAAQEGLLLNKAADNHGEERRGINLAEAGKIAETQPELIWIETVGEKQPIGTNAR